MSSPARVLLVEDYTESRAALLVLLGALGFEARAASDGPTGVELGLAWRPDVAVIDIGLPGLDGFEVARRLRAELGGGVLLVALTAYAGTAHPSALLTARPPA